MHIRFVLFRCVKCLTFWVITGYSLLFTSLPIEVSLCIGFICAYMALWSDIVLGYLANIYEKLSKSLESEKPARHSANGRTKDDKEHYKKEQRFKFLNAFIFLHCLFVNCFYLSKTFIIHFKPTLNVCGTGLAVDEHQNAWNLNDCLSFFTG